MDKPREFTLCPESNQIGYVLCLATDHPDKVIVIPKEDYNTMKSELTKKLKEQHEQWRKKWEAALDLRTPVSKDLKEEQQRYIELAQTTQQQKRVLQSALLAAEEKRNHWEEQAEKLKNIIVSQDQTRGYPTGPEWNEIIQKFKGVLRMNGIPKKYVLETCGLGKIDKCCRYLVCGAEGFGCAKHTDSQAHLDKRAAEESMTALADNCPGWNEVPAKG